VQKESQKISENDGLLEIIYGIFKRATHADALHSILCFPCSTMFSSMEKVMYDVMGLNVILYPAVAILGSNVGHESSMQTMIHHQERHTYTHTCLH